MITKVSIDSSEHHNLGLIGSSFIDLPEFGVALPLLHVQLDQ